MLLFEPIVPIDSNAEQSLKKHAHAFNGVLFQTGLLAPEVFKCVCPCPVQRNYCCLTEAEHTTDGFEIAVHL